MADKPKSGQPDEAYKTATQAVVDDNMRTDVLGPKICLVLDTHTPASETIIKIVTAAVAKEPGLKAAVATVLKDLDNTRKGRWIDKLLGAGGGMLFTVIGAVVVYYLGLK